MKLEYKLLKTEKNTQARLGEIRYNGKIIMPYEVSDSMHIEILDNLKLDDNLLNKIYFNTFDIKNDARKK